MRTRRFAQLAVLVQNQRTILRRQLERLKQHGRRPRQRVTQTHGATNVVGVSAGEASGGRPLIGFTKDRRLPNEARLLRADTLL
jgi:hypothetical protein